MLGSASPGFMVLTWLCIPETVNICVSFTGARLRPGHDCDGVSRINLSEVGRRMKLHPLAWNPGLNRKEKVS